MTAKYYKNKMFENDPKFTEDGYRDSIRIERLESANDPKFTEDHYGFFCDLETAKTMEYDKVEYYVVKVSTKYEVRKKRVGEKDPFPFIKQTTCCFQPESDVENDHKKCKKEQRHISSRGCLYNAFSYLARIPRDIYYSLAVCTMTSTCVYLVMTFSNNSM
jgi:hypothetical protein